MEIAKRQKEGNWDGLGSPSFHLFFDLPEHIQYIILDGLDARSFCTFGCASSTCKSIVSGNGNRRAADMWQKFCLDLLGPAVCNLHEAFGASALAKGIQLDGLPADFDLPSCPSFWKKLYGNGVRPKEFQYWKGGGELLRSSLVAKERRWDGAETPPTTSGSPEGSSSRARDGWVGSDVTGITGMSSINPHATAGAGGLEDPPTVDRDLLQVLDTVARTGHTATLVGTIQVVIGGLSRSGQTMMDVVVVDVGSLSVFWPEVQYADDCAPPPPRFRHTATLIAHSNNLPAIFILGGYNMEGAEYGAEDTYLLHILEGGARVVWQRIRTFGQVPTPRFHHVASAFRRGRKLVVYGGEGSHTDDHVAVAEVGGGGGCAGAAAAAAARSDQIAVYILDVPSMSWRKIETRGPGPGARSLSMGCAYRDVNTGRERLIVTGGFREFERELAVLTVYALDLDTFDWTVGPSPPGGLAYLPRPRHRGGFSMIGPHSLMVMGGASKDNTGNYYNDCLLLHLPTLTWSASSLELHGEPTVGPTAGHTMESLLVFGGCLAGVLGITPVARMDLLLLGYWGDLGAQRTGGAAGGAPDAALGKAPAAPAEKKEHILSLLSIRAIRRAINMDPTRWPHNEMRAEGRLSEGDYAEEDECVLSLEPSS